MTREKFNELANVVYKIPSETFNPDDVEVISSFISDHLKNQVPRLQTLKKYYLNDNQINREDNRVSKKEKADNRLNHNMGKYVSIIMQGYLFGVPVTYQNKDDEIDAKIKEFNNLNDEEFVNSDLGLDCSRYGRAYELVYIDSIPLERFVKLDPLQTFVVYDTSVEANPLFSVRYYTISTGDEETGYVEVCTKDTIYFYKTDAEFAEFEAPDKKSNLFGAVPVIEYMNNGERTGDYEGILDLIDAYDASQSNIANYMDDFADAYLVIQGAIVGKPEDINKTRIINLTNSNPESTVLPKAEYIYKEYDAPGVDSHNNRLVTDMHKFSFTPDMSDVNFSGNATGEAMKWKIFALNQIIVNKQRLFKKGIIRRLTLASSVWKIKNQVSTEFGNEDSKQEIQTSLSSIAQTEVKFGFNIPKNDTEMIDNAIKLVGFMPDEYVYMMLGVEDKNEIVKMLEEQKARLASEEVNEYDDHFNKNEVSGDGEEAK
ncbi:phage portal protein [Paenilisteria newyorkensis]|uniref:phage portal protein n=1 Tax=Listeria newyorkensis TaxID=1497681 RepID=UPI000669BBCB|nr:phage portal protein [Listeria newyorkensis]KMT62563.1 Phage portal protein [Listeria newyorkensis]